MIVSNDGMKISLWP